MSTPRPPAVIYYSRSGHTRRAAAALAAKTGADLIPITVDRYRVPVIWMIRAIWDVMRRQMPHVRLEQGALTQRRWIVIATPVWADQPAPPVKRVLSELERGDMPVGLLTTAGSPNDPIKCVGTCVDLLGRRVVERAHIHNKIDRTPEADTRLRTFAEAMETHAIAGAA